MSTSIKRLQARTPALLALPSIILVLMIAIYPILFAFYTSLTDRNLMSQEYNFVFLSNYLKMFTSKTFWHAAWISLQYVVLAVGVEMLLGFGIAMLLNQPIRGRWLFRILILIPLMLPAATGALMWRALLDPSIGWVNYALRQIGISAPAWLGDPNTALYTVIAIDIYQNTSFVALILLAGLQSIPRLQYEVAEVDGANPLQTFRMVTLPQLTPTIFLVLLIRLVMAINSYDIIQVATNGGPGDSTTTLSFQAVWTGYQYMLFGQGAAYCILLFFIVLLVSKRLFSRISRTWA